MGCGVGVGWGVGVGAGGRVSVGRITAVEVGTPIGAVEVFSAMGLADGVGAQLVSKKMSSKLMISLYGWQLFMDILLTGRFVVKAIDRVTPRKRGRL